MKIVAVGIGTARDAAKACGSPQPGLRCVTDENAAPHRVYGTAHGSAEALLKPGLWSAVIRAVTRGHMQGRATGDIRIVGATFVVDEHGIVRYAHYDRFAGDHPSFDELLQAARAVEASQ